MPTDLGAVSARKRKAQAQAQTGLGIKHSTLVLGVGSICPETPEPNYCVAKLVRT
jgi:hypothetical protein